MNHTARCLTIALICCVGAMACKPKKTAKTSKKTTDTSPLPEQTPTSWSSIDSEQSIDVLTTGNGPVFKLQDFALTADLAPSDSGPQQWSKKTIKGGHQLNGATKWKSHHVDMAWTLMEGNPQTRMSMTLNRISLAHLGEPLTSSITLPKGKLSYISNELRREDFKQQSVTLNNWTPGWIKWTNDTHTLTFADWSFDLVDIERDNKGQITITFTLWNPKQHPPVAACDVKGRETLTLKHHMTLAFGSRQDVIAGRLPGGYESALIPLFSNPGAHPDAELKKAKHLDDQDWVLRARTLLHGHSSLSDPRHGNGGLLGLGQGGTILAPSDVNPKALAPLLKDLKPTRASIAYERAPSASDKQGTFVAKSFPCKAVLGRRSGANEQVLVELGNPHDGSYLNALKSRIAMVIGDQRVMTVPPAFTPSLPGHVVLPQLSGQRSMLTDQLLSKLYLKRLQKERGIAWFSTPMVATRNPLIDAAKDQLLDPERQGHWTLNPILAKALGGLELAQEDRSVAMLGIKPLLDYHRHLKQLHLTETPDGGFIITNNGDTLREVTFIVRSATTVVVDKTPLKTTKSVTSQDGTTQTWFWLNIKKGTTHVSFQEGQRSRALKPTSWNIKK